jgi:hypothetical protein
MPWNNASEIVVAVQRPGVRRPGRTPLPATSVVALNAAFVGLGYATEDGASVTR